jgi:2-alkenal reductase
MTFRRLLLIGVIALLGWWFFGDRMQREAPHVDATPRAVSTGGTLTEWEKGTIELFRAASPSVAYITTEQVRYNPFLGVDRAQGAGSGFIWDERGYVVTNFHVIAGATTVFVQLDAGDPIPARVVGGAEDYDVAVVKLRDVPKGLKPIPVGSSKELQVGQATFAIGNPFGLSRTLTTGIISALERRLPTARGREVRGVIQTDASINPGNSGGPLLDSSGRLIGVTTAILSESGSSAGIGFAIPVDLVNRVVPQLISGGRAARPGIGIAAADERVAARLGIKGVVVMGVAPGSPAAKAGIKPFDAATKDAGDVIIAVNGKPVVSIADLASALDQAGVGNEISLTLKRGDAQREAKTRVIDLAE